MTVVPVVVPVRMTVVPMTVVPVMVAVRISLVAVAVVAVRTMVVAGVGFRYLPAGGGAGGLGRRHRGNDEAERCQ
ncbi:hypothetical protein AB0O34_17985 [Sphaerisporangium sp. NPDC088356]|uniref:hypothetical protein n=1 Tax=Sphaerisporangium sp. NPDC088356 TaxID=3154871 RepID=UPI003416E229